MFKLSHSFITENKLKSHRKTCEYKNFCGIAMSSQKDNILKFNQYMKSNKMPYIIYADLESWIKKIVKRANNPEKSLPTKTGKLFPWRYSISSIWAFDNIENRHSLYLGEDCMTKF